MRKLFTIGFTKKNAREFFTRLEKAGVRRIVDVRLNNSSQLAGFAKRGDLEFFLSRIGGIDYVHFVDLAPTKEILDGYKKKKIDWAKYEQEYLDLLEKRKVANKIAEKLRDGDCFLCSESEPSRCHRRLAAEFLAKAAGDIEIVHL